MTGPTPSWVAQEAGAVTRVFLNTQAVMNSGRWKFRNSIANIPNWLVTGPPHTLQELLGFYPGPVVGGDVVQTEDGYRAVFTKPVLSPPDIASTYRTQAAFAEQFVAGPDPTRLVRMTRVPAKFPITSRHLAAVPELGAPDLGAAMAAGRVYWVDYALTEALEAGKHTDGRAKYMYAPMIALCVTADGRATLPFAIQCGQDPAGRRIYTPADGYSWLLARNTVQVAHHTVHEAVTHLTNTHLVAGRVLESAAVHLSNLHPVGRLMFYHFEGMPFINAQVPVLLTPKDGWFDLLTAATVPSMNDFIEKHLDTFSFQGAALPRQFSGHRTGDTKALSHYPYRDDGMLVWNAISAWITDFVGTFYSSDANVRADAALQSFARNVNLRDFGPTPGGVSDRQGLVEILTTLVWITGPQHAAVNFSQADWMSFCPAAPMAGFTPEPHGTGHTEQDWMDNYPPADIAVLQAGATNVLVGARTTRIGHYGPDIALGRAAGSARRFQKALKGAEETIKDRNTRRARPYTYLQPSKVPSSISV
ncbi:lipoxygenase family protein [Kitasatospora sp. NPDC101183]|uniref:lipoxygenase family protein n=1 Tax=Kitasatospora sp. NPDC101183 TaxID=3364100 RepID=UPI0037F87D17